jgi:hypothetical protein
MRVKGGCWDFTISPDGYHYVPVYACQNWSKLGNVVEWTYLELDGVGVLERPDVFPVRLDDSQMAVVRILFLFCWNKSHKLIRVLGYCGGMSQQIGKHLDKMVGISGARYGGRPATVRIWVECRSQSLAGGK